MEAVDENGADEIWCLGDVTGYGAYPNECVEMISQRCNIRLAGNHDLVILGKLPIAEFSYDAAVAASWQIEVLNQDSRSFLERLEPTASVSDGGYGLFHASPRDPVWEYVLNIDQAAECMLAQQQRVCFVGHSHVACYFSSHGPGRTAGSTAGAGQRIDLSSGEWILNPGAVGQPRDGDDRAAFLLLDTETNMAEFQRVRYPIDEAADAIVEAGLPASLAERLYVGQ